MHDTGPRHSAGIAVNNPSASRYELMIEGQMAVADYRLEGNRLAITHVETPPALRGKGVAAELMKFIVEDAHVKGLTIVPVCPYAASYMARL